MTDMQVSKLTGQFYRCNQSQSSDYFERSLEQNFSKKSHTYSKIDFQLTFLPSFDVYSHIVTALILIGESFPPLRTHMRLLMVTDGSK